MNGAFLVLLAAFLLLSGASSAALAGEDLSEFAFRPHPGAHLPLTGEFLDEHGRAVRLGQYFGDKPVVLALDYLRCKTLCGVTLENLVAGLDALPLAAGPDFQVIVISIDPRDKPADLAAAKTRYLAGFHHAGGDGGWHFLGGRQPAVQRVADAVGFPYRYEPRLDQYIHPAGFVIATGDGAISRYLLGASANPQDLGAALADAAQGRAVGLVERLLLLCHREVPDSGRYGLAIEGAFAVANLTAMIGGIAVFIAIWRRRHG